MQYTQKHDMYSCSCVSQDMFLRTQEFGFTIDNWLHNLALVFFMISRAKINNGSTMEPVTSLCQCIATVTCKGTRRWLLLSVSKDWLLGADFLYDHSTNVMRSSRIRHIAECRMGCISLWTNGNPSNEL